MPYFGESSRKKLSECHHDLMRLFYEVVRHFDCKVMCGYRGREEQDKAYSEGRSTKRFPNSMHNARPSLAADVAPYPIAWDDHKRFYYFGGFVKGIARGMGINIRWGGDWDSDTEVRDQTFNDLAHFELVSKEEENG